MSNPLFDLQQLLTGRAEVAGRVISMGNGVTQIATSQGVVEVAVDGGIRAGNRVILRNGRAVRVQDAVEVPIFFV